MEFLYYAEQDWNDELERPVRVFRVEKSIKDPHPKTLKDPTTGKKVSVKRYFDSAPAFNMNDPNSMGYQGKFGKFMNKRKEGIRNREGKPAAELAKELGLSYKEERVNPYTQKKEVVEKFINSDMPYSTEWEKVPKDKRRIAEQYGFIPQKEFEAPAIGYERVKKTDEKSSKKKVKNIEMEVIDYGRIS